ncbi:transcriptional regulator, LysR family [Burkholderia ambifaria MC40-6]|uniref:Transcriptional regulator, LysR family n=1 Tax=Burkholderia ambifaria (strain MC40-6) TaxID=398577 RepID=B1Z000_BURA4|nr:transcriptional regulator, LysR family [Burkholderia ambifaria MC40-6]
MHVAATRRSIVRGERPIIHLNSFHFLPKVRTDSTSDFEFFVQLAKLKSLSGAARSLGITPPAATKRLGILEDRFGKRLVNRTTRSVSLTPEGEMYARYATQILDQVREMEDAIAGTPADPHGRLRINATLGFGRTTIAPLVSEFAKRYPNVDVQFVVTDRPVDLVEGAFDMAIRFGELPDQRLRARRLMSNRRFLCASPKYLERNGVPQCKEDLAHHRCIIHTQNDDAFGVWRFMQEDHLEALKVSGSLSSNDGDIVLRWALGAGRSRHPDPLGVGSRQIHPERPTPSRAARRRPAVRRPVRLLSRATQRIDAGPRVHRLSRQALRGTVRSGRRSQRGAGPQAIRSSEALTPHRLRALRAAAGRCRDTSRSRVATGREAASPAGNEACSVSRASMQLARPRQPVYHRRSSPFRRAPARHAACAPPFPR